MTFSSLFISITFKLFNFLTLLDLAAAEQAKVYRKKTLVMKSLLETINGIWTTESIVQKIIIS